MHFIELCFCFLNCIWILIKRNKELVSSSPENCISVNNQTLRVRQLAKKKRTGGASEAVTASKATTNDLKYLPTSSPLALPSSRRRSSSPCPPDSSKLTETAENRRFGIIFYDRLRLTITIYRRNVPLFQPEVTDNY